MVERATQRTMPSAAAAVVAVLAVLLLTYFGLFGAIVADELLLDSHVFSSDALQWVKDSVKIIYWPLIAPLE